MTKTANRARCSQLVIALMLLAGVASAQSLSTGYLANNGQSGVMFDIGVKAGGLSVNINDFDVNIDTGPPVQVDVWAVTGGGSFIGNQDNAAAWSLLASPVVTPNGLNVATNLGLNLGYPIPAGTVQGFYLTVAVGTSMNYITKGNTFNTVVASDAFLEIYDGIGKSLVGYPGVFAGTNFGGFTTGGSARGWSGEVYYTLQPTATDDLAVIDIAAPVDGVACEFLTSTEAVTATFANYGSNTLLAGSLVQLDLSIDGGFVASENVILPNDLILGDALTYTFTATADLSAAGPHTVDVTVSYLGDLVPANDVLSKTVQSGSPTTVSTFPWLEDFESVTVNNGTVGPTGWSQDLGDATGIFSDWFFKTGPTSTLNTGPSGDHSTGQGFYAYTEDSGNFTTINLDSPCLDLTTLVNPVVSFWLHSHNNSIPATSFENFLSVDVISFPGGSVTMDLVGPVGDSGAPDWSSSTWNQFSANLSAFAGQLIQIRFRGQSSGGGINHDLAIDDVTVFDPAPTPGQAPQPGLAVFDIENSLNPNLVGIGSGLGGPYATTVTQGSTFNFHFEGESFQPIVVVYGALNPVSATYPGGIGQFDIGGPGVDPNGIPLNIAVFANAIGWVQAGAPGFPFDALFFTQTNGTLDLGLFMPPFGLPAGTVLTTFQSAIASGSAPFVHISNAIEVTLD